MIDLEAIEKRADAATPGPWIEDSLNQNRQGAVAVKDPSASSGFRRVAYIGSPGATGPKHGYQHFLNCEFIAHAREDIPALIARVRELEAEIARWEYAQ